jgi:hypothetical protein
VICAADEAGGRNGRLSKDWILLDNQSNVDVFMNPGLLTNVRTTEDTLTIHTTAGTATTNVKGDLEGYGEVWVHTDGIANIISFSNAEERFRIEYDQAERAFKLHKPDGSARVFSRKAGLYVSEAYTGTVLVDTVAENKSKYSAADYRKAELARKLQVAMGRPSTRALMRMVERKLLPNCPITKQDIAAAEHIFGPDIGSLMGKTTRRSPHILEQQEVPNLPVEVMSRYRDVVLCADIMFINTTP